jgi:3-hydroxyacyl-[acyl-carrier-protein] dehydratase
MSFSESTAPEKKLPVIGLRLCGACNLAYDRDDLVCRLPGLLPEADFVTAQSGIRYAALLVIHGCPIACTSEFNLAVPEDRRVRMGSPDDLPAAVEQLRRIIQM